MYAGHIREELALRAVIIQAQAWLVSITVFCALFQTSWSVSCGGDRTSELQTAVDRIELPFRIGAEGGSLGSIAAARLCARRMSAVERRWKSSRTTRKACRTSGKAAVQ